MSFMTCDYAQGGPPTLAQKLHSAWSDPTYYRAAVLVRVDTIGTPVWDTPDGQPPLDGVGRNGDVSLYTPYTFTVERVIRRARTVSVPTSITGYVEGGRTAYGDRVQSCVGQPTSPVRVGTIAVVIFGPEMGSDVEGATPMGRPLIAAFDVITSQGVVSERGCCEPVP